MLVPVMEIGRVRMGMRDGRVPVRVTVPVYARRFSGRMVMPVMRVIMAVVMLMFERNVSVEVLMILAQ